MLAPSGRAADLLAGRRALARGSLDSDVLAIAPAVRVTRRSRLGVPVGVRANLALALREGGFDVVHGIEPGLPSLSYLALSDARTLTAAAFLSPERVLGPARRGRRERLLARVDALLATSDDAAEAAARRFPGEYRVISPGVDTTLFAPVPKRPVIALEADGAGRPLVRAVLRELGELADWEALLLHMRPLTARPPIPRALRGRVHVRAAMRPEARAALLAEAAIVVPAPGGSERFRLDALAAGCAPAEPPGVERQPELAAAAVARLTDDDALRGREAAKARTAAETQSFGLVAEELESLYSGLARRRRTRRPDADPLADREWIVADLHMHTSWSHDCSIPVADLLEHAQEEGLGAIAVTDHNVFGGALEAARLPTEAI